MRSWSGTRSLTSAPSARMSSSVLLVCCWGKPAIALGSHCLRSRVRHRHVMKGLPRAHLWSVRNDDLGFVLHGGRPRLPDKSRPEKFDGGLIFALELLPGDDGSVRARELVAETHESQTVRPPTSATRRTDRHAPQLPRRESPPCRRECDASPRRAVRDLLREVHRGVPAPQAPAEAGRDGASREG